MNKFLTIIKNKHPMVNQRVLMLAIITKGGRNLSIGFNNKYRLAFPFKEFNGYSKLSGIHAEFSAIKQLCKDQLRGSTIIIFGINSRSNNLVMSLPCISCLNAIKEVGIKRIIYFDKDGKKYIERIK